MRRRGVLQSGGEGAHVPSPSQFSQPGSSPLLGRKADARSVCSWMCLLAGAVVWLASTMALRVWPEIEFAQTRWILRG